MSAPSAPELDHPEIQSLDLATVLFSLSDPARLDLVRRLADGPLDVAGCQPTEAKIPKSTLSHHLKMLRLAGVVSNEPQGRQRKISLRHEDLEKRFPGLLVAVLNATRRAEQDSGKGATPSAQKCSPVAIR